MRMLVNALPPSLRPVCGRSQVQHVFHAVFKLWFIEACARVTVNIELHGGASSCIIIITDPPLFLSPRGTGGVVKFD